MRGQKRPEKHYHEGECHQAGVGCVGVWENGAAVEFENTRPVVGLGGGVKKEEWRWLE